MSSKYTMLIVALSAALASCGGGGGGPEINPTNCSGGECRRCFRLSPAKLTGKHLLINARLCRQNKAGTSCGLSTVVMGGHELTILFVVRRSMAAHGALACREVKISTYRSMNIHCLSNHAELNAYGVAAYVRASPRQASGKFSLSFTVSV